MDVVNQVAAFPSPGETITGMGTSYHPGGKGANQAMAAARSGSSVIMLGAIGSDSFGDNLLSELRAAGIDTQNVAIKSGSTGMAFITVNVAGENMIVLSPGSNARFGDEDIPSSILALSSIILLQNEVPWQTNLHVIKAVNELGIRIFYNPAPAHHLEPSVMPLINTLVLNETEAEMITKQKIVNTEQAVLAASQLIRQGVKHVVITLGKKGAYYASHLGSSIHQPAFPVEAKDTTAAGDTFIGAYASALNKGRSRTEALLFASAASAIAVTRVGAQQSVPYEEEVESFLLRHSHS
jgi:ribokinase